MKRKINAVKIDLVYERTLRQHVGAWVRRYLRVVLVGSDLHRHEGVDVVGFLWRARRRLERSRHRWLLRKRRVQKTSF